MNAAEAAAARARHGYAPLQLMVARDAIAVFVHPDNPLARITLADVDAIFSSTRRCGAPHAIRHWRELGLPAGGTLDRAGLLATGRDASSGTHEVFRETALCGGEFRPDVIAWPGNGAVVATVAGNREAIGYAGIGYVNGLVKPLALARDAADGGTAPSVANVASGRYPLARAIYIYVNRRPGQPLAELPRAFLGYALSAEGQAIVAQEGFVALDADEQRRQRALLE